MHHLRAAVRVSFTTLLGLACAATGCSPSRPDAEEAIDAARGPVEVRLLVVDDPSMSAAIEGLLAEWKARTGTNVVLAQATSEQLAAAYSLPEQADAVLYPSRLLGTLAERQLVAPLPADYASHRELAWADLFELLQLAETVWGQTPHAIPFGSPVLTCYFRPDLLQRLHKRPPQTWAEYHDLARLLSDRENLGEHGPPADAPWHGAVQPLAEGWAGRVLLARAASYAKHRDHYSTLFHIETMKPLIAGPAFERALSELVADAALGPADQLDLDPAAARERFLAGEAALALALPGHAGVAAGRSATAERLPTGFVELPGAERVYNFAQRSWEKHAADESRRVPLLCLAGRLGSVSSQSAQAEAAFQLLAWLSGHEWGPTVSSASPATTLYRRSQVRAAWPWLDPGTDALAAEQYATSVHAALSRHQYLFAPRIPGESRYMAALDAAVRKAVAGDRAPAEALTEAAATWQEITAELGVEAQRNAYRTSLGLEP